MDKNATSGSLQADQRVSAAYDNDEPESGRGKQTASRRPRTRHEPGPVLFLSPIPGPKRLPGFMELAHRSRTRLFPRGIYLSGFEFRRLTGPLVYAWLNRSSFRYVGLSAVRKGRR